MRAITVITNMDMQERYAWTDTNPTLAEDEHASKYACLSEALEDSAPFNDDSWSDGECLDYVLNVIKQLEEDE